MLPLIGSEVSWGGQQDNNRTVPEVSRGSTCSTCVSSSATHQQEEKTRETTRFFTVDQFLPRMFSVDIFQTARQNKTLPFSSQLKVFTSPRDSSRLTPFSNEPDVRFGQFRQRCRREEPTVASGAAGRASLEGSFVLSVAARPEDM